MNPSSPPHEPAAKTASLSGLQIGCLFVATAYVIHFASAPFFFLYEDDYYHVGIPASQSLPWIWEQIRIVCHTWPQGRPGMFITPALIGALINATGSVLAGYVPIFLIVSANGYLAYRLFSLRLPQNAAFLGALFGLVSCADPHKILLTHTALQLAVALNLLGLIFYLNQRPVWAYVIAGSSLFFYEISFAIFASAELFNCLQGRIRWKRLLASWGAWLGVAGTVFAVRLFVGETRAAEAAGNLGEISRRIMTNVTWGPLYGLENSYLHPLSLLLRQPQWWQLTLSLFVTLGVGWAGINGCRRRDCEPKPGPALNLTAALGVLLLLLFGPYALQLKRTVFAGFMRPVSGYHLCLGLTLGFCAALILTKFPARPRWTKALYGTLLLLGCASAYQNLLIQYDYARSARYQAHFWAEVQRSASDAEPGDVILIPNRQLLESEYILSNSWGITHAWLVLFAQTGPLKDWANVPNVRPVTVFLVPDDWETNIKFKEGGHFLQYSDYTPPGFNTGQIPLLDGHVIVLEANFSEPFRRRSSPILAGSDRILLKDPSAQVPRNLPYTKLAKDLFKNFIN